MRKPPLIDVDFLRVFAATPVDELAIYHFGLGLYLRNNVLIQGNALYKLFVMSGITHKDVMSALMLRMWHEALNK